MVRKSALSASPSSARAGGGVLGSFCLPAAKADVSHAAQRSRLLPPLEQAASFALPLKEGMRPVEMSVLLPQHSETQLEGMGICAHWHSTTQDVDYERSLLLRELLCALPPSALSLPPTASSVLDVEMSALKVQAIVEAVRSRQPIDLNSPDFRWDLKQPPPRLSWIDLPTNPSGDHLVWGGMSKRQMELTSFEMLLISLDEADGCPPIGDDVLRVIARQLGISTREKNKLKTALLDTRVPPCPRRVERCGVRRRLAYLLQLTPSDFITDNDFFEWQSRQAAVVGASLHMLLSAVAAEYEDPENSPAATMHSLVDALFMELLATSRPTPHSTGLRRSLGFPTEAYKECVSRVLSLYANVLQLVGEEPELRSLYAVVNQHALPPMMATHVYVTILSTRFDQVRFTRLLSVPLPSPIPHPHRYPSPLHVIPLSNPLPSPPRHATPRRCRRLLLPPLSFSPSLPLPFPALPSTPLPLLLPSLASACNHPFPPVSLLPSPHLHSHSCALASIPPLASSPLPSSLAICPPRLSQASIVSCSSAHLRCPSLRRRSVQVRLWHRAQRLVASRSASSPPHYASPRPSTTRAWSTQPCASSTRALDCSVRTSCCPSSYSSHPRWSGRYERCSASSACQQRAPPTMMPASVGVRNCSGLLSTCWCKL